MNIQHINVIQLLLTVPSVKVAKLREKTMSLANSGPSMRNATSDEFQACEKALMLLITDVLRVQHVKIDESTDFAEIFYINNHGSSCIYMMTRKDYSKYLANPYVNITSGGWTLPTMPPPPQFILPQGSFIDFGSLYGVDDTHKIPVSGWGGGLKPKCQCGSHKVYGSNCAAWQHSDWCECYGKE